MKKTTARLISILTLLCLLLNALGCSDSDEGVSASVVQILVEESEYYEGSNGLSVTTIHDYDDEANIDNADIKMTYQNKYGQYSVQCSAVYEYDRSSDLWSLVRAGEWSDPQYEFSDNLIGEWIFPSFSIKINDINGDRFDLEYHVEGKASAGLWGSKDFEVNGSATVTVRSSWMYIPVQLPDGIYATEGINTGMKETDLYVPLSIQYGVQNGGLTGIITATDD